MLKETISKKFVEDLSKQNNEPSWLLDKRISAYEFFKEKAMPNFNYGLNINLDIALDLEKLEALNEKVKRKVVCNNKEVIIQNFEEVLASDDSLLKEKLMTICVPALDKFTSMHNAFLNNILVVKVPKNVEVKEPIEITTEVNSSVLFDHLLVIAEEGSSFSLVEELNSKSDDGSYVSKIVEIFAEENSKVDYGALQNLNKESFNFIIKRAILKNDASVNWLDCCFGSKTTLSEVTSYLDGEGASVNNHGVFFGNDKQQFDLVTKSIHNAPNTYSDIFTKGALTDFSKCIYRGLVKIQKNASNSNGYQKQDTLLLSGGAAADSIPDLEIDNSDVKCSHGATIGRIDKEKLFYLQSRGLSKDEATKIYVKGFFEELIRKMKIEKMRENMHDIIDKRMQ